jgi:putative addiction module component (TIGR02574 family)
VIAIETLRNEVSQLPMKDRAAFAAFVLDTLPPPDHRVSDEEVQRRWDEMESGAVSGISMEELFSRIEGGVK